MLDVAFTPATPGPTQVAVVVDVLRASSTVLAALEAGVKRVLCVETPDEARALRAPGRMLAGERELRPIDGFDFGNSPLGLERARGTELVLCTTNGTPAVLSALPAAEEVLLGSLLNLDALLGAIGPGADVTVICAGTDGELALEDAYVAGRIVERLAGARTDAAVVAERLASAYGDPYEPLAESTDGVKLRETEQAADIAFCARESLLGVVPRASAAGDGVAVVEAGPLPRRAAGAPVDGDPDEAVRIA